MVAGDFAGDGQVDPAIADYTNDTVLVLMGNGDGTFQKPIYVAGEVPMDYSVSLVVGDFNGDGKLDLALDSSFWARVYVLLSNGDGTFQAPKVYQFPGFDNYPGTMVAGDFNGDGKLDLAVANGESIDVLLGHGDGTFGVGTYSQPIVSVASLGITSLVAADFNGDGKLDLAASSANGADIQVFLGHGDGTFQAPETIPATFSSTNLIVGDFNGDGKPDLLFWGSSLYSISGPDPFLWLLVGNGDGTFQAPRSSPIGVDSLDVLNVVAGDFNRDGKFDLVEALDPPEILSVLLSNGDGTFQGQDDATAAIPDAVALGDFNGDGRIDMAVASTTLGTITILLGDGQGGFQVGQQIARGRSRPRVTSSSATSTATAASTWPAASSGRRT